MSVLIQLVCAGNNTGPWRNSILLSQGKDESGKEWATFILLFPSLNNLQSSLSVNPNFLSALPKQVGQGCKKLAWLNKLFLFHGRVLAQFAQVSCECILRLVFWEGLWGYAL